MLIKLIIAIAIFIILYLLLIMPKLRTNPDYAKLEGWYYAHRGLHNNRSDAPENSIKAFQLAVDNSYGIELDVQLTKDDIPIVFHDYNLKRACGVNLKTAELTYDELRQYSLFNSKQHIPTLKEALECIGGQVPVIVELKIPWSAKKICKLVSKVLDDYKGVYCIETFNPFGLIWYRKNCPNVIRGQLASDFNKEHLEGSKMQYFILKHLLLNFQTKPDFIAFDHKYKKALSFSLCRKLFKAKTAAWTIKSQKELDECSRYFDLFIFDSFIPKE